jgi:hypothetical protein
MDVVQNVLYVLYNIDCLTNTAYIGMHTLRAEEGLSLCTDVLCQPWMCLAHVAKTVGQARKITDFAVIMKVAVATQSALLHMRISAECQGGKLGCAGIGQCLVGSTVHKWR